jgi:hypothetical protein
MKEPTKIAALMPRFLPQLAMPLVRRRNERIGL